MLEQSSNFKKCTGFKQCNLNNNILSHCACTVFCTNVEREKTLLHKSNNINFYLIKNLCFGLLFQPEFSNKRLHQQNCL